MEAENQGLPGRRRGNDGAPQRSRCFQIAFCGAVLFWSYLAALGFYFYVRAVHSLDVVWIWYGWVFFLLEILGSASIVGYVLILTRARPSIGKEEPKNVAQRYIIRVLIPCYKESLEIVQETVMAAIKADTPPKSVKHVYLCDDDADPMKMAWVSGQEGQYDCEVHYCQRSHTEVDHNGKACNLNNALKHIYDAHQDSLCPAQPLPASSSSSGLAEFSRSYPLEVPTPAEGVHEVVAVFDADMICNSNFFLKTLPVLDNCDMVLTPQKFGNVEEQADFFNHANVQMWEYLLPAMDAWGCVSCTGTNFIIRSEALNAVGRFPDYTVTEDFALSLELAKRGYKTHYIKEYLAKGEAPEDLWSICKQRFRWCTGHLEVFFSKRSPLFCSELQPKMRLIYSLGAYSYLCSALLTPLFLVAPVLAIWFGVFPIDLNAHVPMAFALYYGMTLFVLYCSRGVHHLMNLWFAATANLVLWPTYAQAVIEVIMSKASCGKHRTTFETTDKKGVASARADSPTTSPSWKLQTAKVENPPVSVPSDATFAASSKEFYDEIQIPIDDGTEAPSKGFRMEINVPQSKENDNTPRKGKKSLNTRNLIKYLWIHVLTLVVCLATIGAGIVLQLRVQQSHPIHLISCLWCAFNAVAPFLVIYYSLAGTKRLKIVSHLTAILSLVAVLAIVIAMHKHNRGVYDYGEVIEKSLKFYEAQRSGELPQDNRIPWRADSGLLDRTAKGSSLVGGYYDAGDTVKYGHPAAVALSFLAWAMIEFTESFEATNQAQELRNTLKWGMDYFIKAHTGSNEFIAQVGFGDIEHSWWGRPEDLLRGYERVGVPVNATHPGSDIAGSTAAAMAATSLVFRESEPEYADTLLEHAQQLYAFGNTYRGRYSNSIPDANATYPSSSYEDDLAWGALWIYLANTNNTYLAEAQRHIEALMDEHRFPTSTDWDNVAYCVMVIMHKINPQNARYRQFLDDLMELWVKRFTYTPRGLAYAAEWGSLRQSANTAFIGLVYAKYLKQAGGDPERYGTYECWAMFQIRYMLGDGGRSYVCGFGNKPPLRPHHRGASCPERPAICRWDAFYSRFPNPQILDGALVGGPNLNDVYHDDRGNFIESEVALDYNAGFTGAVAGLLGMSKVGKCYWGIGVFKFFRVVYL